MYHINTHILHLHINQLYIHVDAHNNSTEYTSSMPSKTSQSSTIKYSLTIYYALKR